MAADGTITIDTKLDAKDLEKGMQELNKTVKTVTLATATAIAAIGTAIAGTGIKFNAEVEQYQSAFKTMLGSAKLADDMLRRLRVFAEETPFELSDLAGASKTLLAFGTAAEDIEPTLKMLGDISLGNQEAFKGLAIVFGQVQSQGKLMGQDLMQMINQGFNPLQVISEKTGRSMADLKDDMSKGAISFEMVADAMKIATSEGGRFYNAMEGQSKTLIGQWSTLTDNIASKSGEIMKPFSDELTNVIIPAFVKMTESFDTTEIVAGMEEIAKGFSEFATETLPNALEGFLAVTKAIADNKEVLIGLVAAYGTFKVVEGVLTPLIKSWQLARTALIAYTTATAANNNVSVLLASTLKNSELIWGGLTGNINIATAAQALFNNVTAAYPGAMMALGIAAVVGAIVALSLAFDDTVSSTDKLIKEVNKLQEKNKDLTKQIEESKSAHEDAARGAKVQTESAKALAAEIEELSAIEHKSSVDKALLAEKVAQLNELVPNLSLAINEETGALSLNNDEILNQIANEEKLLELEALRERRLELAKEKILIDEQLNNIQEKRIELENELANATEKQDIAKINKELKELTEQENELNGSLVENAAAIDNVNKKTRNAIVEKHSLAKNASDLGNKEKTLNEQIAEQHDRLEKVNAEYKNSTDAITDLYSKYETLSKGEKLSIDNLTELIDRYPQVAEYIAATGDLTLKNGEILKEVAEIQDATTKGTLENERIRLETLIESAKASLEATQQEYIGKAKAAQSYYEMMNAERNLADRTSEQQMVIDNLLSDLTNIEAKIKAVDGITVKAKGSTKSSTAETKKNTVSLEEQAKAMETATKTLEDQEKAAKDYADNNGLEKVTEQIEEATEATEKRAKVEKLANLQIALDNAKTAEEIEKAQKTLNEAIEGYALDAHKKQKELLEDEQKAYEDMLKDLEDAFEEQKKEQINTLKEASYDEIELATENTDTKIKLYNEEYIARVRLIDEELAAFLESNNQQIQAIIERIMLEDEERGLRLKALYDEKQKILDKSNAEKEAREEQARQEKELSLMQKIENAKTDEERQKAEDEYFKWVEEEEYKAREKRRQQNLKDIDEQIKAEIEGAKKAEKEAIEEIDKLQSQSDSSIDSTIKRINNMSIDLSAEKETQEKSLKQMQEYYKEITKEVNIHHEELAKGLKSKQESEKTEINTYNKSIIALLQSYTPKWYDIGTKLMDNLINGLRSRQSELNAVVDDIKRKLNEISSGGDVPMYGTGGIVTTPHLAVVGDVPEAIIPLNQLNSILGSITPTATNQLAVSDSTGGSNQTIINQTIVIKQPVESPAETARAIKNVSKGLAYGY